MPSLAGPGRGRGREAGGEVRVATGLGGGLSLLTDTKGTENSHPCPGGAGRGLVGAGLPSPWNEGS